MFWQEFGRAVKLGVFQCRTCVMCGHQGLAAPFSSWCLRDTELAKRTGLRTKLRKLPEMRSDPLAFDFYVTFVHLERLTGGGRDVAWKKVTRIIPHPQHLEKAPVLC